MVMVWRIKTDSIRINDFDFQSPYPFALKAFKCLGILYRPVYAYITIVEERQDLQRLLDLGVALEVVKSDIAPHAHATGVLAKTNATAGNENK
jgi:hypothetical protein